MGLVGAKMGKAPVSVPGKAIGAGQAAWAYKDTR